MNTWQVVTRNALRCSKLSPRSPCTLPTGRRAFFADRFRAASCSGSPPFQRREHSLCGLAWLPWQRLRSRQTPALILVAILGMPSSEVLFSLLIGKPIKYRISAAVVAPTVERAVPLTAVQGLSDKARHDAG